MKELKKYDIDIVGLSESRHVFEYASGVAFFEEMQQDLIHQGDFRAVVILDKSATMLRLDFHITGTAELECDRSLELFNEPLEVRQTLFLKYGDHNEELTEEIEIIDRNTSRINVARYIYDFIVLALPVKRLHPRFRDMPDTEDGPYTLVYATEAHPGSTDEPAAGESSEEADPRWEALRKLK